MAREFSNKNIVVGAGQFLVGKSGTVLTDIPVLTNNSKTAQIPDNINDTRWMSVGYTTEGTTLSFEPTYGDVVVDQLLDVAKIYKSGMRVTAATSLSETTLENLLVVLGGLDGDLASGPASAKSDTSASILTPTAVSATGFGGTAAAEGGLVTAASAFAGAVSSSVVGGQVSFAANINGGALGYAPVERSICVIAAGPTPKLSTDKSDRFYVGYRAVSMETATVAVKRDDVTTFAVNFRLLPHDSAGGIDGNATYGRIIDRIYS